MNQANEIQRHYTPLELIEAENEFGPELRRLLTVKSDLRIVAPKLSQIVIEKPSLVVVTKPRIKQAKKILAFVENDNDKIFVLQNSDSKILSSISIGKIHKPEYTKSFCFVDDIGDERNIFITNSFKIFSEEVRSGIDLVLLGTSTIKKSNCSKAFLLCSQITQTVRDTGKLIKVKFDKKNLPLSVLEEFQNRLSHSTLDALSRRYKKSKIIMVKTGRLSFKSVN